MPELPEVETVRRALALSLAGRQVQTVMVNQVKLRRPLEAALLSRRLTGRRFTEPRRRGKYLLLDMHPEGSLLVHLGMSGRLTVCAGSTARRPHTHVILGLDDQHQLRYCDPRRFGVVTWLEPGEEDQDRSLSSLGLEPLQPALARLLPALLHSRKAPIKSLLLDQKLVAGVGNIYAAEALWRAGIRPTRAGCAISMPRLVRLAETVQAVLRQAIEAGGTTLRDFASADDSAGYFAIELHVYGRQGEPCPACGTRLRNTTISNRSTVWCGRCQR